MSDSSDDTSMTAQSSSSNEEELIGAYGGQYLPYQYEPLATSSESDEASDGDEGRARRDREDQPEDEDGIRPSQFRDRYNGVVALDQW